MASTLDRKVCHSRPTRDPFSYPSIVSHTFQALEYERRPRLLVRHTWSLFIRTLIRWPPWPIKPTKHVPLSSSFILRTPDWTFDLPTRHKLTIQQSPSPTNLITHQKDPFKRTAVMHRKLSQPLSYRLIQDTSSQALNCHHDILIPSLRLLYFTSILTKRVSSIMHEQLQRIVTENMSQIQLFSPSNANFTAWNTQRSHTIIPNIINSHLSTAWASIACLS